MMKKQRYAMMLAFLLIGGQVQASTPTEYSQQEIVSAGVGETIKFAFKGGSLHKYGVHDLSAEVNTKKELVYVVYVPTTEAQSLEEKNLFVRSFDKNSNKKLQATPLLKTGNYDLKTDLDEIEEAEKETYMYITVVLKRVFGGDSYFYDEYGGSGEKVKSLSRFGSFLVLAIPLLIVAGALVGLIYGLKALVKGKNAKEEEEKITNY